MLKFFRQYNKWILVVGGSLLMVAFLIPQAGQMILPGQGDQEIGQINGEEVTLSDRIQAAGELELISSIPLLRAMLPLGERDEAMHYLLMQREAEALGVSASQAEVNQVLQDLQVGPTQMAQLLQRSRTTEATVREAVRRWVVVQNYLPLILGRAHLPLQERMQAMAFAFQMAQIDPTQAMEIIGLTQGAPRLSEPLLAHFVANQQATLGGEVVLIGHERFLDQVGEPTEEQLTELFNQYRDDLPGASEPYGFGYRIPAGVKLEWLQVPGEAVQAQVDIDEVEALEFFEQNKGRYADPSGATPTYGEAREQVIADLRQRRAEETAAQAARAAQNALREDPAVRRLPREGQYAKTPDDFQPMPLAQAAEEIRKVAGVAPSVQRYTDMWVPVSELSNLPGIGLAQVVGRNAAFADYVASARELDPATDHPLIPLRLQRGLPSEPLRGFDGSYYVFRITDARPSAVPQSLANVRDQVVEDWRKLQAFKLLQQERDRLVQTAKDQGLQALADEMEAPMLSVGPVARRERSMMGMGLTTPTLPGIGQSDTLLDAMFATAEAATAGDDAPLGSLTAIDEDARLGAAPVEPRLSLAVYRVDSYQPITRDTYENRARSPFVGAQLDRVLLQDRVDESPLSLESIASRIGYTGEGLEPGPDSAAAAPSAG